MQDLINDEPLELPQAEPVEQDSGNLLTHLLNEQDQRVSGSTIEGILIGHIERFNADGLPLISIVGFFDKPIAAQVLCNIHKLGVGDQCGVMFQGGNRQLPMIMGKLQQPVITLAPSGDKAMVSQDNGSIDIRSNQEINLQCGDASLRLTSDGRIEIRGQTVVSHARSLNRIRGASIKIN